MNRCGLPTAVWVLTVAMCGSSYAFGGSVQHEVCYTTVAKKVEQPGQPEAALSCIDLPEGVELDNERGQIKVSDTAMRLVKPHS